MITSLRRWLPESEIIVLCIDEETRSRLDKLNLENLSPIFIEDELEKNVLSLKNERSFAEFCWTLTPIAIEVGLKRSSYGAVTYLDADLYFFKSPQSLLNKINMAGVSVAITPHDFSDHLQHLEVFGKFCVQWITINANNVGLGCVQKYKMQCLDWCHAFIDEDRFGDQKYLDAWPEMYKDDLLILEPILGFGAPWNITKNTISHDSENGYLIKESDLIFFHFHQFKIFRNARFFWYSSSYGRISSAGRSMYQEYERAVLEARRLLGPQYVADIQSGNWLLHFLMRAIKDSLPLVFRNFLKTFRNSSEVDYN